MTRQEPKKKFPNLAKKSAQMSRKHHGKGGNNSYLGFFNEEKSVKRPTYGIMRNMEGKERKKGKGGDGSALTISAAGLSNLPSLLSGYLTNPNTFNVNVAPTTTLSPEILAAMYSGNVSSPVSTTPVSTTTVSQVPPVSQPSPTSQTPPVTQAPTPVPKKIDTYLVQFTTDPNGIIYGDTKTIYLVDKSNSTIVPFLNAQALASYFVNVDPTTVFNSINTLETSALMPGGKLAQFAVLDETYGINTDGSRKTFEWDIGALKSLYGKGVDETTNATFSAKLDLLLDYIGKNLGDSGLSQSTLDVIRNDSAIQAVYIGAMGYGGYGTEDIIRDLYRRENLAKGDTTMANLRVIDTSLRKTDFAKTNIGQQSTAKLDTYLSGKVGSFVNTTIESKAANEPDPFYKVVLPEYFDFNSPEFKKKMDEIATPVQDAVIQAINAKTESEKAVADTMWQNTRDQIEKTYGLSLSNNAWEAWNQLETLQKSYSEAGLTGSGIEAESLNEYLGSQRREDVSTRNAEEQAKFVADKTYYTGNASPAEIQQLINEDMAKGLPRNQWRATQWGLVPLTPVSFSDTLSNFRIKNPKSNLTDDEIKKQYYDPFHDEYGNNYSTLYKTNVLNTFQTTYGYNPTGIPSDVGSSIIGSKQHDVMVQGQLEVEKSDIGKTAIDRTSQEPQPLETPSGKTPATGTQLNQEQLDNISKQIGNIKKTFGSIQEKAAPLLKNTPVTPTTPTSAPVAPTLTPIDTIRKQVAERGYASLTTAQKAIYNTPS